MSETGGPIQQFVHRTGQLYSLPAVAAEVLRLTSEPAPSTAAIRECLERDPALAARLLRVVNSSLFGLSRPVSDLNQALSLLGIRPLKMLVLGFSLPKELFAGVEAAVLSRYWRRSLVKAVAARELAERLWRIAGDEPFIAGLVQDIGLLALVQQLGDSFLHFLEHLHNRGGNLLAAELESLGFDHLVLSSRLLGHWGLPENLVAAVAVPPDEVRIGALCPTARTLPQILHLADLLAQLIEQPYGSALRDLLAAGSRYCGLTYDSLQPIVARVQERVAELAQVLALQLPSETSYVDLLIAAQQRLADEALLAAVRPADTAAEADLLRLTQAVQRDLAAVAGSDAAPRHRSDSPAAPLTKVAAEPAVRATRPSAVVLHERRSSPISAAASSARAVPAVSAAPNPSCPTQATGVEARLVSRLSLAIHHCRQARRPLTLALVEVEHFSDLLLQVGPAGLGEVLHCLRAALADWSTTMEPAFAISDSCTGLVWEDCPRNEAVARARNLLSLVKPWSAGRLADGTLVTLSIGLATIERPPKNFRGEELIEAARRCLSAAQLSGGDTAKSIEI